MNSARPICIVVGSAFFSISSFQEVRKELIVAYEIKLV